LPRPQGELSVPDPPHEKDMVLAGNGFGFVAAHLARRHAARRLEPPNPIDHRAGRRQIGPPPDAAIVHLPKPPRRHAREGQSIRVSPSMLASFPASMLNQNRADSGIPNRFCPKSSRSRKRRACRSRAHPAIVRSKKRNWGQKRGQNRIFRDLSCAGVAQW
jgi:hypothetical protein